MTGLRVSFAIADRIAPSVRSAVMRAVRGRDAAPEMRVRRLLHAAGYRLRVQLRLGRKRPDLVFTRRRQAIFVHGCFWHGHDCPRGRLPTSNAEFWRAKIARNKERDAETEAALTAQGWRSLVVWECGLRDDDAVLDILRAFLGPVRAPASL
jgi:DNA mismatch endonuclease (patch repair protein)